MDWIKHGFICKYNQIDQKIYDKYISLYSADYLYPHLYFTEIDISFDSNIFTVLTVDRLNIKYLIDWGFAHYQ